MRVRTHNDWDPLREIVVGTATGARVPTVDRSTMSFGYASYPVDAVKVSRRLGYATRVSRRSDG